MHGRIILHGLDVSYRDVWGHDFITIFDFNLFVGRFIFFRDGYRFSFDGLAYVGALEGFGFTLDAVVGAGNENTFALSSPAVVTGSSAFGLSGFDPSMALTLTLALARVVLAWLAMVLGVTGLVLGEGLGTGGRGRGLDRGNRTRPLHGRRMVFSPAQVWRNMVLVLNALHDIIRGSSPLNVWGKLHVIEQFLVGVHQERVGPIGVDIRLVKVIILRMRIWVVLGVLVRIWVGVRMFWIIGFGGLHSQRMYCTRMDLEWY